MNRPYGILRVSTIMPKANQGKRAIRESPLRQDAQVSLWGVGADHDRPACQRYPGERGKALPYGQGTLSIPA